MSEFAIDSDEYLRISRLLSSIKISELDSWKIPVKINEELCLLRQTKQGSCSLFAVLQTYIIKSKKIDNSTLSSIELMYKAVVDVMTKLSGELYVLCSFYDDNLNVAKFIKFEKDVDIINYLRESKYLDGESACLLLAFSYTYIIYKVYGQVDDEPFIDESQNANVMFALIILTGEDNSIFNGSTKEKDIGFAILDAKHNGVYLNKYSSIYLNFRNSHFFASEIRKDNDFVYEYYYDTLTDCVTMQKQPHSPSTTS